MTTQATPLPVTPSEIQVTFQSFEKLDYGDENPLIIFAFEEQPDTVVDAAFPEIERMRLGIEKNRESVDDMTHLVYLTREDKHVLAILVYVGRKWRSGKKRRNKQLAFGSIQFYQILGVQMHNAIRRVRNMGHTGATIILPGRFHPKNLKKDPRGEREEEFFVRTLMESVITANLPDSYVDSPRSHIDSICFTHFGDHEQTATHFFNRAVGKGVEVGNAVAEARTLTTLPPNEKTPLLLARRILGVKIKPQSFTSPLWRKVVGHRYGSSVKASVLHGSVGLQKAGFGLIAAVGKGSKDQPCFLKLHYRPRNKPEGMKKITLIGKGVVFDTGGLNLKVYDQMEKMHYDMAGAATVASVFRIAVETHLPVEIVALLPLVENMVGSKASHPHDIVSAYDGQTVELTDTDSEGRLILGDAIAYSEKHLKPDVTVTVATLCDMSDFGPDFLKVLVNNTSLERRARIAERRSFEKMMLFPHLEHFENVNTLFTGTISDLKNEHGYHYHTGMVFLSRFLQWDPSPWLYLDVAAVFEKDADEYGSGPGFGVRFLWQFIKQFART